MVPPDLLRESMVVDSAEHHGPAAASSCSGGRIARWIPLGAGVGPRELVWQS